MKLEFKGILDAQRRVERILIVAVKFYTGSGHILFQQNVMVRLAAEPEPSVWPGSLNI
jgi:hypothetical protein